MIDPQCGSMRARVCAGRIVVAVHCSTRGCDYTARIEIVINSMSRASNIRPTATLHCEAGIARMPIDVPQSHVIPAGVCAPITLQVYNTPPCELNQPV